MPPRVLHYSDLEGVYDAPERAARLAGLIGERRTDETVVVGTGDSLGPSVLSLVTNGRQTLDLAHAVQPDAVTVGNHDFDRGVDTLRAIVEESPQPWLTTNCYLDGHRLCAAEGALPHLVVEAGDHRVGLAGVTSPDTPTMNPLAAPVTVTDPVAAVEDAVADLRAEHGVDSVVVLAHLGTEPELVETLDCQVDAVCGGHVHSTLATVVDGTPVSRPGACGHAVCEIEPGNSPRVRLLDVADGPVDEPVRDALRDRIAAAGLDEVVGRVAEPISLTDAASKCGESRAGNLVTDCMRWAGDADVAVVAHGALRPSDPLSGDVTAFELLRVVPFDDELVRLTLSGRQLRTTLSQLVRPIAGSERDRDWSVGQLSGATAEWDAAGDLVAATVGGERLDDDGTYSVATSTYYVETDHLFDAFGESDAVESVGSLHEAMLSYARENGLNARIEGRIGHPNDA